jgi:acyl dehydratase
MAVASIDDIRARVGSEVGVSDWILIDQAAIDAFADVTQDHQFIHVDPEAAARTPFGGTIAHGFLTLSLLSRMAADVMLRPETVRMGVNYGFEKVRFIAPVHAGKRVRGRFRLDRFEERSPGQFQFVHQVTVEIEGEDKPALIADWIGLIIT